MFLAGFCSRVWVASTCSTSEVPMPKASAPKAPCVRCGCRRRRCVMPGRVSPAPGPTIWTMPWRASVHGEIGDAEFRDILLQRFDLEPAFRLGDAAGAVARSAHCGRPPRSSHRGRRTLRPASTQPFEGLRAGHFMDEMAVDIEEAGAVLHAAPPHGHPRSCRMKSLPSILRLRVNGRPGGAAPGPPAKGRALGTHHKSF